MKKKIVLTLYSIFLGITISTAQSNYIGLKIGANYARILDEDTQFNIDETLFPSPNVGFVYYHSLSDYFGIHSELVYSQKGDQYRYLTGINPGEKTNTNIRIHAIEVPVLVSIRPTGESLLQPYLNLGLGLAYLIDKVGIKTDLEVSDDDEFRASINKGYNQQIEYSLQAGAGLRLSGGDTGGGVSIDFRYARGLVDVFASPSPTETFTIAFLVGVVNFGRDRSRFKRR